MACRAPRLAFTRLRRGSKGRVLSGAPSLTTTLLLRGSPDGLCSGERPLGLRTMPACLDQDSYLVDSASSHMLVSKIKPCMSKYKQSIL